MQNSLAANTPHATPAPFEFEGREWKLWPMDTEAIAAQLERWVAQHVRANVEKLRPGDDNEDPLAWRVYNEDKAECQRAVQRGEYGALMPNWYIVLTTPGGPGFAELVYQCARFKDADWTRAHVKRLLADKARYELMYSMVDELNFPKAQKPGSTDPPPEKSTSVSLSTGGSSLPEHRFEDYSLVNSSQ